VSKPTILIIDDEPQIRKLLTITLQQDYAVTESATAKEGLTTVANHPPDLVLLDLGLPDENGHNVLKHLREWYTNPIIVVSVQNSEADIVKALDNGANDYLVKPFRTGELTARVRSAIRNAKVQENVPSVRYGDLSVDFATRTVRKNGNTVKLTSTEYSLLGLLIKNEGKVLTHHFLLREIWGPSYVNESQYLRVFVAQLRKKVEADANRPSLIITESGVGYRFAANS
jgi:two-component system, OmpR family, KDP operon response regulator KdpE